MSAVFRPAYFITAHKINFTPERLVSLENPDRHTLEAINNGHSSNFYSYDETNFDEIYLKAHDEFGNRFGYKPFYFRYNNSDYDMGLVVADYFPPAGLLFLVLALFVASVAGIVVISLYKVAKFAKSVISKKSQQT